MGRVDPLILEDAKLMASEIITNAVTHGCDPCIDPVRLDLMLSESALRVQVEEPNGVWSGDAGEQALDTDESGRGLSIVRQMAAAWGISTDTGTSVWFELPSVPLGSEATQHHIA